MANKSTFKHFLNAFAFSLVAAISTFASHIVRKDIISISKSIS
jgi:hypothetical protein